MRPIHAHVDVAVRARRDGAKLETHRVRVRAPPNPSDIPSNSRAAAARSKDLSDSFPRLIRPSCGLGLVEVTHVSGERWASFGLWGGGGSYSKNTQATQTQAKART